MNLTIKSTVNSTQNPASKSALHRKFLTTLAVPLALMAVFLLSVVLLFSFRRDSREFTELTSDIFINELLPNTLNMHYTVAHPEDYGIYSYTATLPVYTHKETFLSRVQLGNYCRRLSEIRAEKLTAEDAYTYALLQNYLETARLGASFSYYDEPLSPGSGAQSQLPTLLAEYTFRTKRDVLDYLVLLSRTGDYFDGLLRYEQEKAEAGLFMPDYSLKKVCLQCNTILTEEDLSTGNHFLQTTFRERLSKLLSLGIITQKEAERYLAVNDKLLATVMLPAYESLSDELSLLQGKGANEEGLAHTPQGKEYYAYLVRQSTGSSRQVKEIKTLLYQQFAKECQQLQTLVTKYPSLTSTVEEYQKEASFPFDTPEEVLSDLQERMADDFPAFPQTAKESEPACTVKTVSDNLEPFSAPAFYLTPPLDDSRNNVIYINESDCPAGLSLYTTLAHEGYPGHLYQSVYHQLYRQQENLSPVRELLWYGGYLEGWALYTEFLSYDYAAEAIREAGCPETALCYTLEKQNRSLQLCLFSILDLAIHYDGASPTEVAQMLSNFGIISPDTCRSIYEYIVEEPANYLKYYLGYLEILQLKEEARTLWGTGYSDLRFHTFLLENGPADFDNLSKRLQQSQMVNVPPMLSLLTSARIGRIHSNP